MKYTHILGALAIMTSASVLAGPYDLPIADSGLVSVFPGQTVKLNVVSVAAPTASCSFALSLIDNTGITVAPLTPSPEVIAGGESTSLSLAVPAGGTATQVRARIDFTSQLLVGTNTIDPMGGCYKILPTVEVITDGVTTEVLNTAFYGLPSQKEGDKIEKVKICHKPNTPAEKTLWLPISAVKGHLGHDDQLGDCSLL